MQLRVPSANDAALVSADGTKEAGREADTVDLI